MMTTGGGAAMMLVPVMFIRNQSVSLIKNKALQGLVRSVRVIILNFVGLLPTLATSSCWRGWRILLLLPRLDKFNQGNIKKNILSLIYKYIFKKFNLICYCKKYKDFINKNGINRSGLRQLTL